MLMVFNLLPIPPLDGSQIVFTLLPERYAFAKVWLAKNGPLLLLGLIIVDSFTNVGIFSRIFTFILNLLFGFLP